MAIRVDNAGYLLDGSGTRLDAQHGNDAASVQKRFAQIVADWQKNHKGEAGPPKDTTIMQVEKGDSQWRIAEGAGADPVKTYTQLNAQFDDPNLIHPGDIVFVDKTTELAVDRNGNTNVDIFRDQQQGQAEAGQPPQALGQDSRRFFASVPDHLKEPVFNNVFQSWPSEGETPDAVQRNRQAAVEGFLASLPADQQQGKLQELRNTYDPAVVFAGGDYPDESTSVTYDGYNAAIDAAAADLKLPPRQAAGAPAGQQTPPGGMPPGHGAGTGNQPVSAPTDAAGNPITDPKLVNIFTAARQSGGSPNDPTLKNGISDFVNVGAGTAEEFGGRVTQLFDTDFGPFDYQVNDYAIRFVSDGVETKLEDLRTGDEKKDFIRTYLNALPDDKPTRQAAVNELLRHEYDGEDYAMKRWYIKDVAEDMGLTADVSFWTGDVNFA